ncbi:hypothetical protein AA313_de0209640 [Arthrobotrys entomopaga]|nr:hypothetical protein AA313_de0209640 [Arthrobotrys entomopaga]
MTKGWPGGRSGGVDGCLALHLVACCLFQPNHPAIKPAPNASTNSRYQSRSGRRVGGLTMYIWSIKLKQKLHQWYSDSHPIYFPTLLLGNRGSSSYAHDIDSYRYRDASADLRSRQVTKYHATTQNCHHKSCLTRQT